MPFPRAVASWLLYWLGDVVSIPMRRWDLAWLDPAYQWLMGTSGRIQVGNRGPWRDALEGRKD
jgi:hypothetical protein